MHSLPACRENRFAGFRRGSGMREMGRCGDQRHAAVGSVEIGWAARLPQVFSRARVNYSRGGEVTILQQQTVFAEIKRVTMGTAQQVEAEPFEVCQQLRLGHHVGAGADCGILRHSGPPCSPG